MNEEAPRRERQPETRCRCLLVYAEIENWCGMSTSGPDDPFCSTCTDRHVGFERGGVTVSVVPIGGLHDPR